MKDARKAVAKPSVDAQVALEVEQDERAAARVRREWDLRDLLLERAFSDVNTMTAKEARRALQSVTGLKDLQFVERLARGRSTDKTDASVAVATGFRAKFFGSLDDADVFDPTRPPEGDAAVERGDGAPPEPLADPSGGRPAP